MPDTDKKARPPREPWIIRPYAGFGDAREANQRFLANLKQGQRGLSIAFDLPTQNGYDPDAPVAAGEGRQARVSLSPWGGMQQLLEGGPPAQINTPISIKSTSALILRPLLVDAGKERVRP